MVYYLIGTTLLKGSADNTWREIKANALAGSFGAASEGSEIAVEKDKIKLGNLDSLMFLNDSLMKLDTNIEALLKKIERQYQEIEEDAKPEPFKIETRDGTYCTDKYLFNFKWDDSRFPRTNKPQDIQKALSQRMMLIEAEIRQKSSQHQDAKTASSQVAKKEGNLYSRDLVDVLTEPHVKGSDFIYSDYLTTLVAVIPSDRIQEFRENYEKMHPNIVPNSLKQLNIPEERDGLTCWRMVVMKLPIKNQVNADNDDNNKKNSPVEQLIKNARDKHKTVVREFTFKGDESKKREQERLELEVKTKTLATSLKQTCQKGFSDLYITYAHLKHLRFIVDSAMRFGHNEKMLYCIIKPAAGKEKKVTQSLLKMFSQPSDIGLFGTKEELEDTEDFFPFIYIPITIF